jgi:hypothetical protein
MLCCYCGLSTEDRWSGASLARNIICRTSQCRSRFSETRQNVSIKKTNFASGPLLEQRKELPKCADQVSILQDS